MMDAFLQATRPVPESAGPAGRAQPGMNLRPLTELWELKACVLLQEEVWGPSFGEAVPVSLLKVATYLGGLAIGAFDANDEMLGFVFGLTGTHEGRTVHWSHLLGVRAAARGLRLGRTLKEYQRAELARRGIDEMFWTFDPLIAKNAHLNLNVLGARVVRYEPDMYGTTVSTLHHGLPTDRLVVVCSTGEDARGPRTPPGDAGRAPVLTPERRAGDPVPDADGPPCARLRLEIPLDFDELARRSPTRAAAWHAAAREHLLWAQQLGYKVVRLDRDPQSRRAFYILALG
jgi:predicted GNAT superfamily acetyltransferase